jgi:hypothetical protein
VISESLQHRLLVILNWLMCKNKWFIFTTSAITLDLCLSVFYLPPLQEVAVCTATRPRFHLWILKRNPLNRRVNVSARRSFVNRDGTKWSLLNTICGIQGNVSVCSSPSSQNRTFLLLTSPLPPKKCNFWQPLFMPTKLKTDVDREINGTWRASKYTFHFGCFLT